MSGAHSYLAASSAGIWRYCAGAPLMESIYPDDSSLEAAEGEASHWVVATVLESYIGDEGIVAPGHLLNATCPENGVVINEDMIECAEVMITDVLKVCQDYGLLRHLHIEEQMAIPSISDMNGGTPDCWIWDENLQVIYLWDYKYGHRDVPADSWQNKNYIAGIMDVLDLTGGEMTNVKVVMKIVQPRSYNDEGPIKEYRCDLPDLVHDLTDLKDAASLAVTMDPGVASGTHCRDCKARHSCKAARHTAATVFDTLEKAVPDDLTTDGLSYELTVIARAEKILEHRKVALTADAIGRITNGEEVPGFAIGNGKGRRRFNEANTAAILAEAERLGIDMYAPAVIVTPAKFEQAVKKLDSTVDVSVISEYIETPSTGVKLIKLAHSLAVRSFKTL